MTIKPALQHLYKSAEYKKARDKSRRRAKGKCQFCRIKNGARRGHTKIILCTRHVNGNPADNSRKNLLQLCQACHLEAQRVEFQARQLALFTV